MIEVVTNNAAELLDEIEAFEIVDTQEGKAVAATNCLTCFSCAG